VRRARERLYGEAEEADIDPIGHSFGHWRAVDAPGGDPATPRDSAETA
jgi:hypothetical protein